MASKVVMFSEPLIPILIILTTEEPLPASPWQATVYTHLGYELMTSLERWNRTAVVP